MEGLGSLLFMGLLILIFYMLLIRPQKRRVEEHRKLVDSIEVGDEVVTIGGAYGTVRRIGEDDLDLEVSPGNTIRFVRTAIARKANVGDDEAEVVDEENEESPA